MTITQTFGSGILSKTVTYKVMKIDNEKRVITIEKQNGEKAEMKFNWFAYAIKHDWIKLYL